MRIIKVSGDTIVMYLFITSMKMILKLKFKGIKAKQKRVSALNVFVLFYTFLIIALNIYHCVLGPLQMVVQIYYG